MTNDTVHLERMLWFDDWIRKNNIIIVMCLKFKSAVLMRACPKKNYLDWSSTACKLLIMCFGVSGRKSHSINTKVDFWATLETVLAVWASDIQIVLVSIRFHSLTPYLPQAPPREMCHRTRMFTLRLYFVKKNHFKFSFPENEKSTRQNGRVIYDFYWPERAWHSHWRVGER